MRFAAVIAEYNPFHRGHAYQLAKMREAGATHIGVVMSPYAVQRGELSFFTKWARAEAALQSGADLVLELPVRYALAPAYRFALGAVGVLNGLGLPGELWFGSECGDIGALSRGVEGFDSPEAAALLKEGLKAGLSYPAACARAAKQSDGGEGDLFTKPNNILGAEYLRALKKTDSPLQPRTLLRVGAAHDSLVPAGESASAAAVRNLLAQGETQAAAAFFPEPAKEVFTRELLAGRGNPSMEKLFPILRYRLLSMEREELKNLPEVAEGLENRIREGAEAAASYEELLFSVKSKRYPMSRVKRILLNALLGLEAEDAAQPPPYIRVLGLNPRGREILRAAKSSLPVYHSFARLEHDFPYFARAEFLAGELFSMALPSPLEKGLEYKGQHALFFSR